MKTFCPIRRALASMGACVVFTLICAYPATASPQTDALLQQGAAKLAERRPAEALPLFEQAAADDPNDSRAAFFIAAALNQLARFDEALVQLDRARAMGSQHPQLDFQTGWAQMRLGMHHEAIESLQRYEQAVPGEGQTSEFLGRCYLAIGETEKAQEHLTEAVRRDANLQGSVELAMLEIAYRSGDPRTAASRMAGALRSRGPVAQALQLNLQAIAMQAYTAQAPQDDKPLHIAFTIGAGYNSNVLRLNDAAFIPSDVTNRDAAVVVFELSTRYDVLRTDTDYIGVGYVIAANIYEGGHSENHLVDQTWYFDYVRTIDDQTTVSLLIWDQYLNIGGNSFRNRVAIRPSVARHVTDWLSAELAYTFTWNEYYVATGPFTDRDGTSHGVSITAFIRVPDTELDIRLGYAFYTYDADGGFFDHDVHALSITFAHPIPVIDVNAELTYSHMFYENDFFVSRDDNADAVSLRLSKQIKQGVTAFVQYDFTNNDSNSTPFNYDQHVVTGGITLEY